MMFKNPQKTGFINRIPIRLVVCLVLMLSALTQSEVMAQNLRSVSGQVVSGEGCIVTGKQIGRAHV